MSAIQGSPAACAIVLVGWWVRGAVNKHMPDLVGALQVLGMAIQAATMNAAAGGRPVTKPRNTRPKTDPIDALPQSRGGAGGT